MYEIVILGEPTDDQVQDLQTTIQEFADESNISHAKISWLIKPSDYRPDNRKMEVVIFYGAENVSSENCEDLVKNGIPIIPVVSNLTRVCCEIPLSLQKLNCLSYDVDGVSRLSHTVLAALRLLPLQRRVFISYRRTESREVALQLFEALSARCYDVFLDTHDIVPSVNFQNTLWHRLCESDFLLMLDTQDYFNSRWSTAEFARALSKNISIYRVGWPGVSPSARAQTILGNLQLSVNDLTKNKKLKGKVLSKLCSEVELIRSKGLAIRRRHMLSNLTYAIESSGGQFVGLCGSNLVKAKLLNEKEVVLSPTFGVPTSFNAHEASEENVAGNPLAIVYDHIGLKDDYINHIDWLQSNIPNVHWLKSRELDWLLGDWEEI